MESNTFQGVSGSFEFAHGSQKMLGWFGGHGLKGTMSFFTQTRHIPAVFAFLAIAAEFFGGLGLVFGLLTRIAAFGITVDMRVAVYYEGDFSRSQKCGSPARDRSLVFQADTALLTSPKHKVTNQ
jgi:uncharacterized membrane protein YphA (DoxX/SURF4 family)